MANDSITPREAFIYICFNMISVDRDVDDREVDKLFDVLQRYGLQAAEIRKVSQTILSLDPDTAFERGLEYIETAKQLDEKMRKDLVHAMLEIGEADRTIDDSELTMLYAVKAAFGMD